MSRIDNVYPILAIIILIIYALYGLELIREDRHIQAENNKIMQRLDLEEQRLDHAN